MLHEINKEKKKDQSHSKIFSIDDKVLPASKLLSTKLQGLDFSKAATSSNHLLDYTLGNKFEIPQKGVPEEISYTLISNELKLDGKPHLNLASFVTTQTTSLDVKLIQKNINNNLADNKEYHQLI